MTTYMHCRPYAGTNTSICTSSFHFILPGFIQTTSYQTYTPTSYHYHDEAPPPPPTPPPPPPPSIIISTSKRRRRLEDPITTYASNYYSTLPNQISQGSPSQPPPPPPLPPPRQIYQQSDRNGAHCDLFNLLERPVSPSSPVTKQRRKQHSNDLSQCRNHRPTDFDNVHTKLPKNTNERKLHHQQSYYYKEKKRQDDKLSSTEKYDRSLEKTKKMNDIYHRRSPNKGFFRRVVRNYFCMPTMLANNGYSS